MWIHNKCSLITESEFDSIENTNCTWICPKCDFFNFSDSFFADQLNLENENRFDQLANGSGTKASQTGSDKNKFITGLKFVSININSIRGKKLELLAFLDFHQPQIVAIQETKIDSSISTSELFPESCPYNVYRKDRTLDGGGVMLLIHRAVIDIADIDISIKKSCDIDIDIENADIDISEFGVTPVVELASLTRKA